MIVGVTTEVIAGEGLILTAGGIDTHIHFICPQQASRSHRRRAHHDDRRRHRPGHGHLRDDLHARRRFTFAVMLQATDALPLNFRFHRARATPRSPPVWRSKLLAGAIGLKLHEDWGTTPGGDRLLSERGRRTRRSSDHSHRHAERVRLCRSHDCGVQGPHHSHLSLAKGRAAAMRRTSSASAASRMCCRAPPTPRGLTPSTRSTSISTCSWSAIISTRTCRRMWPLPKAASAAKPSRRRTSCTTWAPSA